MTTALSLIVLPERLAICRLEPTVSVPDWARSQSRSQFCSITHTATELSIVCPETQVPPGIDNMKTESGWCAFQVMGTLDFGLTGILAAIATPLATAQIGIFAISTYDTDYVLVKHENRDRAIAVLTQQGHRILKSG